MSFSLPAALVNGNVVDGTDWADIRNSLMALSHAVFELGGSEFVAMPTGLGYNYVPEWKPFTVASANHLGFVYKLVFEAWTENVATSITVTLRNFTDSTDTVVASASTATARGTYNTYTVTIAAGKEYRLMASKSNDTYNCWCIGRIVRAHA